MCADHLAQYHSLEDREIECRRNGCNNVWIWKRGAQLAQLQHGDDPKPPSRLCEACFAAEREVTDREVPCRISGCSRRWTWTREAQLKHRAWLLMRSREDSHDQVQEGNEQPRSKRRRGASTEPPPKLCSTCTEKAARLTPRETVCRVHGCTRTAVVDKDAQLQAWAALGTDNLDAEPTLPKRMCDSCHAFCQTHPDKKVPCGRPECDGAWSYKTGAQLQAHLAGRQQIPIRLCASCSSGKFLTESTKSAPKRDDREEIMPCVVPGCSGTWVYSHGMDLDGPLDGELPLRRMCVNCRAAREGDTSEAGQ
jgi:hypothetical protein